MVIIIDERGQLANRLVQFSHFLANSLEYGYPLLNPGFTRYAVDFEGTHPGSPDALRRSVYLSRIALLHALRLRYLRALYRAARRHPGLVPFTRLVDIRYTHDQYAKRFDLNDTEFVGLALKRRTFVEGWLFRDYRSVEKHKHHLRRAFAPVARHRERVNAFLGPLRNKPERLLVGVHVRRGDYRQFEGGRFLYTDPEYLDILGRLRTAFGDREISFVLCSNEDAGGLLRALPAVAGPGDPVGDLYVLAGCDFLVGPPSSYTIWASYYGSVPLLHIEDPRAVISPEAFRISRL